MRFYSHRGAGGMMYWGGGARVVKGGFVQPCIYEKVEGKSRKMGGGGGIGPREGLPGGSGRLKTVDRQNEKKNTEGIEKGISSLWGEKKETSSH